MNTLNKTTIYKIEGINYIGSTTYPLHTRERIHNNRFVPTNRDYNKKLYRTLRANNHNQIKLIPLHTCFVGNTARKIIEQRFINQYDSINNGYNTLRAYVTEKERKCYYRDYMRKKKKCDRCGCMIRYGNYNRHRKTKRCITRETCAISI